MRAAERAVGLFPWRGACSAPIVMLGVVLGLGVSGARSVQASQPLTVFAAASLADAVDECLVLYERTTGVRARGSYAASSTLAQQIAHGAPAQIFISADERWMDHLAARGLIDRDSRVDLLANRLVIVAAVGSPGIELTRGGSLPATLRGRVAVGDPSHVPAGAYARQALERFGWWAAVAPRLLPALDVRAALRLVELGEADAGIVYATEAAHSRSVSVVAVFPDGSHDPIRYPAALVGSPGAAASALLSWLRGETAAEIFARHGFERIRSR